MKTPFEPYSIRNLRQKSAKVADNGFTATLLRNGHPVATMDCGKTSEDDDLEVEFVSEAELEFFKEAVAKLSRPSPGCDMPDDERFLRDLVEHTYHAGRIESLSRHSTLFRLEGDPPNQWRQVRAPYRSALARLIRDRFPRRNVEFATPR